MNQLRGMGVAHAYLLLTLAPLTWGANAVAGKLAAGDWPPFTLSCLRWGLVCVVLLPFAWRHLKQEQDAVIRHLPIMLLLGGIGQGGFNLCLYYALNHISAINASIEQAAMPVLIMLFNFLLLRQRVLALQIIGLLVTLVGVLVTVTHGDVMRFFAGDLNHGDLIMLLGSVFYAAYTFGLRWRPPVRWICFLIAMSLGGFLFTLPFALWEASARFSQSSQDALLLMPSLSAWLVLGFIVVFPTLVGQLCYAKGVDLIGANRAGLFINLVPVFGSILAVLVLAEYFRWYHAMGLALVLFGIALAEQAVKRQAQRQRA